MDQAMILRNLLGYRGRQNCVDTFVAQLGGNASVVCAKERQRNNNAAQSELCKPSGAPPIVATPSFTSNSFDPETHTYTISNDDRHHGQATHYGGHSGVMEEASLAPSSVHERKVLARSAALVVVPGLALRTSGGSGLMGARTQRRMGHSTHAVTTRIGLPRGATPLTKVKRGCANSTRSLKTSSKARPAVVPQRRTPASCGLRNPQLSSSRP